MIGNSTVGKFVVSRLNQLGTQVQSDLTAQQTAITNDAKALESQRATLSQEQLGQRANALKVASADFQASRRRPAPARR